MNKEANWFKRLSEELKSDPVYIAEGVAVRIAAQVNAALEAEGITRKNLAERLGVSQPYVTQILSGQTNMTILTLAKVSIALGLELSVGIERRKGVENIESLPFAGKSLVFDAANPAVELSNRPIPDPGCFSSTVQSCAEDARIA